MRATTFRHSSASVTFEEFVRPALLKMAGHTALHRPTVVARMDEKMTKSAGRLHFVRVHLSHEGSEIVARSTGNQSSGMLSSMMLANGLMIFPRDETAIAEGASVEVQVLDPTFLDRTSSGF